MNRKKSLQFLGHSDGGSEQRSETEVEGISNEGESRYARRERRQTRNWWFTGNAALVSTVQDEDPETYAEEMSSSDASIWQEAIDLELARIESHGTLQPCRREKGMKTLTTKFVFKKKRNAEV